MDRFLDALTMEQLEGEALELAEIIELEAFKKLVAVYGGAGTLYIPRLSHLRAAARDRLILGEYRAGRKAKYIDQKYQFSEQRVHQIVQEYYSEL